jgi:hypothetical protein
MSARDAPTAIRIPISLMRSDTELSIMFMTPTPVIVSARAAIVSRFGFFYRYCTVRLGNDAIEVGPPEQPRAGGRVGHPNLVIAVMARPSGYALAFHDLKHQERRLANQHVLTNCADAAGE